MADTGLTSTGATGSSWLSTAAPIIGGAIDAVANVAGGLFSANQARKNRAFQERMYQRQLEDNRENWRLQNEYNLPSAQLQRLKDAGLNPLLMYGDNGLANVATGSAQGASAPHGDSAKMGFQTNFGQALLQSQLIQAQIRNMNADSQQKETGAAKNEAETESTKTNTEWMKETYNIRVLLEHGKYDWARSQIREMDDRVIQRGFMNAETASTMAQARVYEIKRFNLDVETIGTQLQQRWADIASGRIAANAQLKNAAANMMNAVTQRNISHWQIGMMAQEIVFNSQANPLKLNNMRWQSWLNKANFNKTQAEAFNQALRNGHLDIYGSEELNKSTVGRLANDIGRASNGFIRYQPLSQSPLFISGSYYKP